MTNNDSNLQVGLTYAERPRTWGLRFSILDGIVLAVTFVVAFLGF